MVRISPDPHETGYQCCPTHHVTAVFDAFDSLRSLTDYLEEAGIYEGDVKIFVGQDGVDRLELTGKHHGVIVRVLYDFARLLSDDTEKRAKLKRALHDTGHVVSIETEGDEKRRAIAIETLKAKGGKYVFYWDSLFVEQHACGATC